MSGKVVSWAFEQVTGSPAAKLVLVKLADNSNDAGFCWVGLEKIVVESELSQSAVYKHLAALHSIGLVRSFDTTHPEHGYPIRAFQLSVPEAWRAIPPRGKGKGPIPPGGKPLPPGGNPIPAGGKTIPPGGIPYKEEPSLEPPVEPSSEPQTAPPVAGVAPQTDLLGDPIKALSPAETASKAFLLYDQAAERLGWSACQARTEARAKKIARRLEDAGGLEGWVIALSKAEASDFLMGRTAPQPDRPPFKLDIDFLLQQSSFVKLMEGKYDNRTQGPGHRTGGGYLGAAARVAERLAANAAGGADRDQGG